MRTISWGLIQSQTELFKGFSILVCANHGGIIVNNETMQTHPYFEKVRKLDLSKYELESGDYAFEQDCESSIVLAMVPRAVLESHYDYCTTQSGYELFQNSCLDIIKCFNPDVYTALFK